MISSITPALNPSKTSLTVEPNQFYTVAKDGVEIACPKQWRNYSSDPSLVYGVSRIDTIRIVTGVSPALSQNYYDGLVDQGIGYRTTVAGYLAYRNDYSYSWNGHELTDCCITAINGDKACHIMILCDTEALEAFQPTFDYVINSLKFQ